MSIHEQVKSLTEDIADSYEARIAAVTINAAETHHKLGNFHREREKMASTLKRSLTSNRVARTRQVQKMRAESNKAMKETAGELQAKAKQVAEFLSASESERKRAFATLIGETRGAVATIEEDTARMLADFRRNHREMAEALNISLASETSVRRDAVAAMLAHFAKEQQEMAKTLHNDLASFQNNLSKMVEDMQANFSADQQLSHTYWQHLTRTLAAKRAGKPALTMNGEMAIPPATSTGHPKAKSSHSNSKKKP